MAKCLKCMRATIGCMCPHLTPVDTKTHFVILMHPMEYKREKNGTGRLTHLQLPNSKIIMDIDFTHSIELNQILQDESRECVLLYPGPQALNLSLSEHQQKFKVTPAKTLTVILIDATWCHAKKMLRLSRNLHQLPRICFDSSKISNFILKQQPSAQCLSTIEAVDHLLAIFNQLNLESADFSKFLNPFQKMIEFQVECIKNPHNKSYRPRTATIIRKKNMYRKEGVGRSLFYQG